VILRASPHTYVEVYVDDNGTNSRLRIDVVIAGVRTNRATTNLVRPDHRSARAFGCGAGSRADRHAEHFTPASPTAPTREQHHDHEHLVHAHRRRARQPGRRSLRVVLDAADATATLDEFAFQPFIWRNMTLPQLTKPLDAIPGIAPALAAAHLTTSSTDTSTPIWPLLAWGVVSDPGLSDKPPFGIFEAESFINLSGGWASASRPARAAATTCA
jgi:hypothetical protein